MFFYLGGLPLGHLKPPPKLKKPCCGRNCVCQGQHCTYHCWQGSWEGEKLLDQEIFFHFFDFFLNLTPPPGSSGTSMSSKTPGRDLEDRWSLDKVLYVWILMKLSQKLLKDDTYHLTPTPGSSGPSIFPMTPGRDLEDRWCLDKVSDVGSCWNFHRSLWRVISIISRIIRNFHVFQDSRKREE